MANVKYKAVEFKPTANQKASGINHSWYASAVINNTISNAEMAQKIAARTGFKAYEALGVLSAFAEIAAEELLESNAVIIGDVNSQVVTLTPKVSGSVSDNQIKDETTAAHQKDANVPIRTEALESDLTISRLTFTVDARVGTNFSKAFAQNKSAKKVKVGYVEAETTDDTVDEGEGM